MNRKIKTDELERLTAEEYAQANKLPLVVVLDNIRSGLNVGSIFRTSDALLVQEVHLCGITCQPPQMDIQKTALGATNHVRWRYWPTTADCIASLKKEGFIVASVEQAENTTFLHDYHPDKKQALALVFGNEVKGVGQEIVDQSDFCIEIKQLGVKHSFNVAVCAGIVLWHVSNKLQNNEI
jgi:23S rRNA (guanosine2251-2'-O)-methyltransferase